MRRPYVSANLFQCIAYALNEIVRQSGMGPLVDEKPIIFVAIKYEDITPPYPLHIPSGDHEDRLYRYRLTNDFG